MAFEADQKSLEADRDREKNLGALFEKAQMAVRPIDFEKLYRGESLLATALYGGLTRISEAYGRIHRFVQEFVNQMEKGLKPEPEIIQRTKDSLSILEGIEDGIDLKTLDKKAAEVVAADSLRRARNLKDAGILNADERRSINAIYSEIQELLNNSEVKLPLAATIQKVEKIERHMQNAVERGSARSSERQTRAQRKK